MEAADIATWSRDRHEFSLISREQALDAREAALDERERRLDARLADIGELDDGSVQRREARAERARERELRRQDRLKRDTDVYEKLGSGDYPLAAQFTKLATLLYAAESFDGVLQQLITATSQVIPNVDAVSVTVHGDKEPYTAAASSEFAVDLDQLQYRHGEGPSVDAVATPGLAYSASADLSRRASQWPSFAPAATRMGCTSVLSLGMFPEATQNLPRLGSLNVYSTAQDAFTEEDRMAAMLLAAHGSVAMASAAALEDAQVQTEQLYAGMVSRDVIGQAKGILMERQKVTPEQAFDLLRNASNRLNTKLIEVAEKVAQTGEAPR